MHTRPEIIGLVSRHKPGLKKEGFLRLNRLVTCRAHEIEGFTIASAPRPYLFTAYSETVSLATIVGFPANSTLLIL
jgi:hypothetical protein